MFHGSIVALVTPMDDRGRIDFVALQRLVDFHLKSGTDGIVIAGTTGEASALTESEFKQLLSRVVEQVDAHIPVLAGTGSASTASTISRTRLASEFGADGALVVTPYYTRPMQSGLVAHYNALADASTIPLVIYNVPSRTAVDILPATVAELAQRDEIVAIKEAVPDMTRIRELVSLCGQSLVVLSGDDPSCLEAVRNGAKGVVSVAANVVPGLFHDMCESAQNGNWQLAVEIDDRLRHLYDILALETNPIPVKWALFRMALMGKGIRLPLLPLSEKHYEKFEQGLKQMIWPEWTGINKT
jgi:4-hydroxy-tetrahydrodipicolinate synthase